MDQTDWKLIRTIHTYHSMAKAAELLFISQPAVFYRVNRMEEEYGTRLFTRNNKGISLTSAGERLLSFADLMLQYASYIHTQVNCEEKKITGHIDIGVTTNFFAHMLAPQLKQFYDEYPGVGIKIVTESSSSLVKQMNANQLMLSVVRGNVHWNGPSEILYTEPHVIISSKPIDDNMLHTMPYLYDASPNLAPLDDWLNDYFGDHTPVYSPIQLQGNSIVLKALVEQGAGWAIIPYTHVTDQEKLFWKPLCRSDGTEYQLKTKLIYSEACRDFDTYLAYIDHVREYFRKITSRQSSD